MIDFFFFLIVRYKKCEEEVCQELIELQEQEREMACEWGGPKPVAQGQLDRNLAPEESLPLTRQERAELQHKLEETGNLPEQVWPLSRHVLTYLIWQYGKSPLV